MSAFTGSRSYAGPRPELDPPALTRTGSRQWSLSHSFESRAPMRWRAELLKISNPPSDLAGTLDKALDRRAQSSIFQSHERKRPWPKRQVDREDFERVETRPRTGIGREE